MPRVLFGKRIASINGARLYAHCLTKSDAFQKEALFFCKCQQHDAKWHFIHEVTWRPSFRTIPKCQLLDQPYKDNYSDFFLSLGVSDMGELDGPQLVAEITSISQTWIGKSVPTDVCIRLGTLLDDAFSAGFSLESQQQQHDSLGQPRAFEELRNAAIFPVAVPMLGTQLLSSHDSRFYIADRSSDDLARIFAGDFPIMRMRLLQDEVDLRPFEWDTKLELGFPEMNLSGAVSKSITSGNSNFDDTLSRLYRTRMMKLRIRYVLRYIVFPK